jgi:hypothetical protein
MTECLTGTARSALVANVSLSWSDISLETQLLTVVAVRAAQGTGRGRRQGRR